MSPVLSMSVRLLTMADIPQLLAMERNLFGVHGWQEEDFAKCVKKPRCFGFIAEIDRCIIGYIFYELHKMRLIVTNIGVAKAWQNQGVGEALIQRQLDKLLAPKRCRMHILVPESNLAFQLYLRKKRWRDGPGTDLRNFQAIGVYRKCYDGVNGPEDGYLMEYVLSGYEGDFWED